MSLSIWSTGAKVRELQSMLNQLPSSLARLTVDGIFGPKTYARVVEFQKGNHLTPDGIVGPLTLGKILDLLKQIGQGTQPGTSSASVRSITQSVLGLPPVNGLIQQMIPSIPVVNVATFTPGSPSNTPSFTSVPPKTARLGIFAAGKGGVERAVILLLPESGTPERVMIGISHGFGQNAHIYHGLGWEDPLSPPLIQFVLLKHVVNRWGAQVLAGKRPMALLHIVRAAGKELGPFASDGIFTRDVLTQIRSLTADAFSFDSVEACTFSSGINDFNTFVASITGVLNVTAVYNIDPSPVLSAPMPSTGVRKQYLSGMTGASNLAGFETMALPRWKNEQLFPIGKTKPFQYLHNHCLPGYALHLGIQTS